VALDESPDGLHDLLCLAGGPFGISVLRGG
jgi:hypothetical protein